MTDNEKCDYTSVKCSDIVPELKSSISVDWEKDLNPTLSLVAKSLEERSKLMQSSAISILQDLIDQYNELMQSHLMSQIGKDVLSSVLSSGSYLDKIASSSLNLKAASSAVSDMVSALEELNDSENFSEDDFVTCDKESIKEWNVPDTIAIPIGNNRIRMKTELFITLIGIIIPIFLDFAGHIVDLNAAASEAQAETQRTEIEEKRNELIQESNQLFSRYLDIIGSIDESHSSKADQIESWKESLLKSDFAPTDSDSTPNQIQVIQNSSLE